MLSEAQLLADVDFMLSDLPNREGEQPTATIGDNDYDVTQTSLSRDKVLQVEGMEDRYRLSLYVNAKSVDDNSDRPEINDTITYDDTEWTVLNTTDDDIQQLLRLDLGEEFARGIF